MNVHLGYSTYALPKENPFDSLTKIKELGYEAVEICMGDAWPTSPTRFGPRRQQELAGLARRLGFPSPILFGGIDVCVSGTGWDVERQKTLEKFQMARDLHYDNTPTLITTTSGHHAPSWDSGKEQIRDAFLRLADFAAEHEVIIAIEAHAGTDFQTPEKAAWMMTETAHPNLKLDLDISHFYVEGADVDHSVDLCAPDAVMVHVKDGEKVDGKVQYCLPGEGTLDLARFLQSLGRNHLTHLPVYAEVSVQISRSPDYDPWRTAKFCFDALDQARRSLI